VSEFEEKLHLGRWS